MPFGRGFGFRGWSPAWPYVGLGRGGFPRCWAYGPYMPPWGTTYASPYGFGGYPYGAYAQEFPVAPDAYGAAYTPYGNIYPGYPFPNPWESPYASPGMTPADEKEWLKKEAESIRKQMDQINNRISELEKE